MSTPFNFSFWLLLLAFFLALSCSNQPEKAPGSAVKTDTLPPKKPLAIDYPKDLAAVPEFPGRPYRKVIAYELNGRYGNAGAASVFENRMGKQVELTDPQVGEFLSLAAVCDV